MRNIKIYDVEVYPNFMSYADIDIDTDEEYVYHLYEENNIETLIDYLKEVSGQIGFNNIGYDYPILHLLLTNVNDFKKLTGIELCLEIYKKSQDIINNQERFKNVIHKPLIPQRDLFKINHFDNKNRSCSLKDVAIVLKFDKIQDLPYKYDKLISPNEIEPILLYNRNDVMVTKKFYESCKDKITLRQNLSTKYNLQLHNYSNAKIGSEILLDLYCKKTNLNKPMVRELRTVRKSINLKDCIFPYINFTSAEFKSILTKLQNTIITETKNALDHAITYRNNTYYLGLGGIHFSKNCNIFTSSKEKIIFDVDVQSFYGKLATNNNLYPKHLGPEFCELYKNDIVEERIREKNKNELADKAIVAGLKESTVTVFGNSNSSFSWLYDSKYTMTTTIGGQLSLLMLVELLHQNFPELDVIQANTDGLTVIFDRENYNRFLDVCKKWEQITSLELEYKEYTQMIIIDVSNYIAIDTKGKAKYKGLFEFCNREIYKDHSQLIVPIALSEYFIKGVPIVDTITSETYEYTDFATGKKYQKDIFDYCLRQKTNKECYSETIDINNGKLIKQKQQKTTRYYISNKGSAYQRVYFAGKQENQTEAISKGYLVTIFNDYTEAKLNERNINHLYYIKQCNKIINLIEHRQLSLLDEEL